MLKIGKSILVKVFKPWLCKHDYYKVETYHGDRIIHMGYSRSKWKCKHCNQEQYSEYLDKLDN